MKRERDDMTLRLFDNLDHVVYCVGLVAYRRTFIRRGITVWKSGLRKPLTVVYTPENTIIISRGTIIPNNLMQSMLGMFGSSALKWGNLSGIHDIQIAAGNTLTLQFGGSNGQEPLFTLS